MLHRARSSRVSARRDRTENLFQLTAQQTMQMRTIVASAEQSQLHDERWALDEVQSAQATQGTLTGACEPNGQLHTQLIESGTEHIEAERGMFYGELAHPVGSSVQGDHRFFGQTKGLVRAMHQIGSQATGQTIARQLPELIQRAYA